MEFVRGRKISDIEGLRFDFPESKGVKKVGFQLNAIFGKMLFKYGHIHCDAHPGNILVRRLKGGEPQIVLLDHGFYATLDQKFMQQFCELWYALVTFNNKKMREVAQEMGVGEYYRYLPILFTYRTINSKKPFAARFNKEEKKFMVQNDEINFQKISYLLQLLPAQLTFIFKAIHCVGIHNSRCGGTTKDRLLTFSGDCIDRLAKGSKLKSLWLRFVMWFRILLFSYCFPLFRLFFGFEEAKFDPQSKAMLHL